MGRVVGLGGVFFKSRDPEQLYGWYEKHLGLAKKDGGVMLHWRDAENREQMTIWALFPEKTKYFEPSKQPFMLNYIVEDLPGFLTELRAQGVTIDKQEEHEYGKFAWIEDPEGNRIELWEPPRT